MAWLKQFVTLILPLLAAMGVATAYINSSINDVRKELSGDISKIADRVNAIDNRLANVEGALRADRQKRLEDRTELEQKITQSRPEQLLAKERAESTRRLALARVASLEYRIAGLMAPSDRVAVGTLHSVIPVESLVMIQGEDGQVRAYNARADIAVRGYCGADEEKAPLSSLKVGTAVLVAYNSNGGRPTAKVIVRSTCV